jgi:hypothetical protein
MKAARKITPRIRLSIKQKSPRLGRQGDLYVRQISSKAAR